MIPEGCERIEGKGVCTRAKGGMGASRTRSSVASPPDNAACGPFIVQENYLHGNL